MLNIPYILSVYEIKKLSHLIENIDAPVIDINLALWAYEKEGVITIDRKKDTVDITGKWVKTFENNELLGKLKEVVRFYNQDGRAVNRGKLEAHTFSQSSRYDPPRQDFFLALDWAVEQGEIFKEEVEIENEKGKKLKFVVYWVGGYERDEMINNFISDVKMARKKNKLDVE